MMLFKRTKPLKDNPVGGELQLILNRLTNVYGDPELCIESQIHVHYAMMEVAIAIQGSLAETNDPRYISTCELS